MSTISRDLLSAYFDKLDARRRRRRKPRQSFEATQGKTHIPESVQNARREDSQHINSNRETFEAEINAVEEHDWQGTIGWFRRWHPATMTALAKLPAKDRYAVELEIFAG